MKTLLTNRVGSFIPLMIFLFSVPLALSMLTCCKEENEPPIAKLEVTPLSAEAPAEVRMKLTGEDPDGIEDIKQYILKIGNEDPIKKQTPIEITRHFEDPSKLIISGEVIDSKNQYGYTGPKQLEVVLGPYIEQSANLVNDVEINYSATIYKFSSAELKINRDGVLFSTQTINDNSQTGEDFNKTFKYSPDKITKGTYEFVLKAGNFEKKNSVVIQNYKPTINLTGINTEAVEGEETSIILPKPYDKNPEDMPVKITNAKSLDEKTQVALNSTGDSLKIKAKDGRANWGEYYVELEFGSNDSGLEKAVLSGNITQNPIQYFINPFVSTNPNGAAWDLLKTPAERMNYLQEKMNEDWTRTIPAIQDIFDCTQYAFQFAINFHGFPEGGFPYEKRYYGSNLDSIYFYGGTYKDNGKYGLPVYRVRVEGEGRYHQMNAIMVGDDIRKWEDWCLIESPRNKLNVQPGELYILENCKIRIRGTPKNRDGRLVTDNGIVSFDIKDKIPKLIYVDDESNPYHDPYLKLITQRGK
jgi:hypothetical protein